MNADARDILASDAGFQELLKTYRHLHARGGLQRIPLTGAAKAYYREGARLNGLELFVVNGSQALLALVSMALKGAESAREATERLREILGSEKPRPARAFEDLFYERHRAASDRDGRMPHG